MAESSSKPRDTTNQTTVLKAVVSGRTEDLKLFENVKDINYDWALAEAASRGRTDEMAILKDWGATNYEWALYRAADCGKIDAMKLLRKWGAADFEWALTAALTGYKRALGGVTLHHQLSAIELLQSWQDR